MSKFDQKSIENILKYYNRYEWYRVLPMLREYCSEYPEDYSSKTMYINTLLSLGYIEEAKNVIFNINPQKIPVQKTKQTFKFVYLKSLILEKKYQEAYDYILSNEFEFHKEDEIYYVKAFLKSKLSLQVYDIGYEGYVYGQFASYSEEAMKEHTMEYHTGKYADKSVFNPGIDLDKLIQVAKDKLEESEKIYRSLYYCDIVLKLTSAGMYKGRKANYVVVSFLNDSDNIIFIKPGLNEERYPYTDISSEFLKPGNTRRLSQIEKFNNRYNKNTSN